MNTSQWGVASRMIITHREIKLGDTISLMFVGGGWDNAKAIKVTDSQITLCRPWMDSNDGYPRVNLEIFEIWRDSDKTVALLDRVQE